MSYIVGNKKAKSLNNKRGFEAMKPANDFLLVIQNKLPNGAADIFDKMDLDHNGSVSVSELTRWIVKAKVFSPTLNDRDARFTCSRIFNDIDTDKSGYLSFEEFRTFLDLIRREQTVLDYASKHRLTQLPASVRFINKKQFSLDRLEENLHLKIQQLTSRDSDRYRQILTLFKHQVQRSKGKADDATLHMTSRDFNTFLSMLGLFATREQADLLFQKYDGNGDGCLSVHEFLTRAKAPDYPGLTIGDHQDDSKRRGKKQFNNTAQYGIAVKASTPSPSIYNQGTESICDRIRERLEQTARTGSVLSDFKARRKLFRAFECKDPEREGLITVENFKQMLEVQVGVLMGGPHLRALCAKYAKSHNDHVMIEYPRLVMEVYPASGDNVQTSLYRSPDLMSGGGTDSRAATAGNKPRWNDKRNSNQVHLTGSYWKVPNARQGEKSPLPPLSRAGSRGSAMGGMEIRGRTPGPRAC